MTTHLIANQSPHGPMIVSKERIQREAQEAALLGKTPNDACAYPFTSEAGRHFLSCYQAAVRSMDGNTQRAAQ